MFVVEPGGDLRRTLRLDPNPGDCGVVNVVAEDAPRTEPPIGTSSCSLLGPVERIKSAKSLIDDLSTRASRAIGAPGRAPRGEDEVDAIDGEMGTYFRVWL